MRSAAVTVFFALIPCLPPETDDAAVIEMTPALSALIPSPAEPETGAEATMLSVPEPLFFA